MKVLFYISTIRGGGAARVMVNIANGIIGKECEVCFVTNFPADHEYELNRSIKRIVLESEENMRNVLSKNLNRIRVLHRILKAEQPDVSIAFMRENNFRLIVAAKGTKTKTIVSVRNDPTKEYPDKLSRKLANILYNKANGIVFQTEDAKAYFSKNIQNRSRIIFNQVDEKFYSENKALGEYIIACGRLSGQKNYPMMLKAFAGVLNEYPHERLRIYGEGDLKEELMELAKELNIEKSVQFMGFSTEMHEAYRRAKFLVMTSNYEGMPNVILEALASSVPVIATDCPCGGPRMVIRDGENGYLVPIEDCAEFESKMKSQISNVEKSIAMKEKAYLSAKAFTPSKVLVQWVQMIDAVYKIGRVEV